MLLTDRTGRFTHKSGAGQKSCAAFSSVSYSLLILNRICGQIFLNHQSHLEDDSVVELSQIQTGQLLNLLQTVDQGVTVNKQLSGGFRNIQVVLKELLDGKQRFVVQAVDGAFLKDLLEEHFAQGGRQPRLL